MKFGGTSVQDAEAIRRVIEIIKSRNDKTVIVISAFATVTNNLVRIIDNLNKGNLSEAESVLNSIFNKHFGVADDLGVLEETNEFISGKRLELLQLIRALDVLGEISAKSQDMILSYGEEMSSLIVYNAMKKQGINAIHADAGNLIKTDSNYTEANIDYKETYKNVLKICKEHFRKYDYIITGGFIGSDKNGRTTTLGRGGSDYSAAVIAAALNSDKLEIWTDVSGIMTSDPRMIKDAKVILKLSYSEASELAYFGAKVLHPKTIFPAVNKKIPVFVLNTFHPEHPGTKIVDIRTSKKILKAIAFRKGVLVINIHSNRMLGAYGFLSKVFEVFDKYKTSVDLVTTAEVSISLTVDDDTNMSDIIRELKKFATINVQRNMSIIALVGEGIRNTAGIASRFFGVLNGINIVMVSVGASEVNMSIVVSEKDVEQSVRLLHSEFFEKIQD